jgi:DNA-binding MarR family transcriptional regulator
MPRMALPKPTSRLRKFRPEQMHDLVGYQLRRSHMAVFRNISRIMAREHIAPGDFGVLLTIRMNPERTQSWIARACGLDRSTIAPVVQNLEALGYVRRRDSAADRRAFSLSLTARGIRLMNTLGPKLQAYENHMTRNLSNRECVTLVRLLRRLEASA